MTDKRYTEDQLAGKLIRFVNFIIDILLISVLSTVISKQNNDSNNSSILLIFIIYYVLFEFVFGKTIGKFITKTSVKNLYGNKLTFLTVLGRTLLRLIPLEAFTLVFDGKADAWHDRFSSTIVVLDSELHFEHYSLDNEPEPEISDDDSRSELNFEHYSLDKNPRPEILIRKNSFLYPEDGLGKMESGTVDSTGKLKQIDKK